MIQPSLTVEQEDRRPVNITDASPAIKYVLLSLTSPECHVTAEPHVGALPCSMHGLHQGRADRRVERTGYVSGIPVRSSPEGHKDEC